MRVSRREQPASHPLEIGMFEEVAISHSPKSLALIPLVDEYVSEVANVARSGNDTGEADLAGAAIDPNGSEPLTERCTTSYGNVGGPVRASQEGVDHGRSRRDSSVLIVNSPRTHSIGEGSYV